MAKLFPDSERARVIFASSAEEQFYNQARCLPDPWLVFYSRTLSNLDKGEGLRGNEIDFLAYHPHYGVLVIEVKGGRIHFEPSSGEFFSINRHDEKFKIKNPFQQALVWKSRFVSFLRNNGVKVPVSHAVCFPSAREDEFPKSAELTPEIIIGRNRINQLDRALRDIAMKSQPEKFLQFTDVASDLIKLVGGTTFTTKLYLRDYLNAHELRLKDIESIHESLVTPIASQSRLAVEGEAGTGKTMLALMIAKKYRDEGRSVLLLSSNSLLTPYLLSVAGPKIDVSTYTEFAAESGINLLHPPENYTGKKEDWIQYDAPERWKNVIVKNSRKVDVLICDEAQDVQPFWWESIESLQANVTDPKFYLFFDRSQGVFGSGGSDKHFDPGAVLPIEGPYFPLVHNYRTTREIAGFSRAFRTGKSILQSHCGRLGYVPEIIKYKDGEDCKRLLGGLIRKLVKDEEIATREITILSARIPDSKESVLYKTEELAKYPLHFIHQAKKEKWTDGFAPRGRIAVSTIAGFKGLESSICIITNLSEYNLPLDNPMMASLFYVASTRAKHMLYIMVKEGDPKISKLEEGLKGLKTTGSIVLEGSQADFEFSGTVTHYNPERVGWLSVSDPAFQKTSIMFFPHDVQKSELESLKKGTKLIFRPKIEGTTMIAIDLKKAA